MLPLPTKKTLNSKHIYWEKRKHYAPSDVFVSYVEQSPLECYVKFWPQKIVLTNATAVQKTKKKPNQTTTKTPKAIFTMFNDLLT